MKNTIFLVILVCLFFSVQMISAQDIDQLHDKWVLADLKDFNKQDLDSLQKKPTLVLNTTEFSYNGFTGCNQFQGSFEYKSDTLRLLPGPMTKAYCDDDNLELIYTTALVNTNRFERLATKLKFFRNDQLLCTFSKAD